MPKRINPQERIIDYFENAPPDAAEATLNVIKAILKRKLANGKLSSPIRNTSDAEREDQAFNRSTS